MGAYHDLHVFPHHAGGGASVPGRVYISEWGKALLQEPPQEVPLPPTHLPQLAVGAAAAEEAVGLTPSHGLGVDRVGTLAVGVGSRTLADLWRWRLGAGTWLTVPLDGGGAR